MVNSAFCIRFSAVCKDSLGSCCALSLLRPIWRTLSPQFEKFASPSTEITDEDSGYESRTLERLPADFIKLRKPDISVPVGQFQGKQLRDFGEIDGEENIAYDWATSLARGVGTVLHSWLQHNANKVLTVSLDANLMGEWEAKLRAQQLPKESLHTALKRMQKALLTMQNDDHAAFIFGDHREAKNEAVYSYVEDNRIKQIQIDRTFIDTQNHRWIIDYKTTTSDNRDLDRFVDEQIEARHRRQLERYGKTLSQLDTRTIELGVYFPLLGQFRHWTYST